jgi:hypothetical protein
LNPLGFSDAIVQLTAVHFHNAGFALPIVVAFAASRLRRSALIPTAVFIGVPSTAIGITIGGWLEWIAATTMAGAGLATAGLLLLLAARGSGSARRLIGLAGSALAGGMALALGWSWSMHVGWELLGLDAMAATNAIGLLEGRAPAGFRRRVWKRDVAHGDFAAACASIRQWNLDGISRTAVVGLCRADTAGLVAGQSTGLCRL